jgi:tRNA threonylcarbamoyl adenosine modification protein (Sua5/YciO/YrdC/YwlC family)
MDDSGPAQRHIATVVNCLINGGVIIYPTDTIYGLGCDIFQQAAIEKICRIKKVRPEKAQLSFVCYDLSDLSHYTKSISTPLYRVLREYLPGTVYLHFTGQQRGPPHSEKQKEYDRAAYTGQ